MADHRLQRSRLGEQMGRARNDLQVLDPAQPDQRLFIEFDDAEVGAADDEQRGRLDLVQRSADELLESKNFGMTSLNEVREKLGQYGLSLRGD